jgi:DNA invertase Pin-like site-specific DNA recombinase
LAEGESNYSTFVKTLTINLSKTFVLETIPLRIIICPKYPETSIVSRLFIKLLKPSCLTLFDTIWHKNHNRLKESNMKIGYMRVSTNDQRTDLQEDALKKEGCDQLFSDIASGAKTDRPGLEEALSYLRKGDTLVVWKLDRLGRSLKHLIEVVNLLDDRGIYFKSIQESIDTSTSGGKLIFHVFGALAEFERDIIRERTMAGLKAARARGRKGGRPKLMDDKMISMAKMLMADHSNSVKDVCETLGVSRSTLYRNLKE